MGSSGQLQVDGDHLMQAAQPFAQVGQTLDTAAGATPMVCTVADPQDVADAKDRFDGAWGGVVRQLAQGADAFSTGLIQAVLAYANVDQGLAGQVPAGPPSSGGRPPSQGPR